MKFPRIRFSLRTLLLATLLVGGVMLVWRVREPWAFKRWTQYHPSNEDARERERYWTVSLSTCDLSPSGRFLLLGDMQGRPGTHEHCIAVLNLDEMKVGASEIVRNCRWHNRFDWLLTEISDNRPVMLRIKNANDPTPMTKAVVSMAPLSHDAKFVRCKIVDYQNKQTIFESEHTLSFSKKGRFLKEESGKTTSIYEAKGFKRVFQIERMGESDFVCNDHMLIRHIKRFDPDKAPHFTYALECYDVESSQRRWCWDAPKPCYKVELDEYEVIENPRRTNDYPLYFSCYSLSPVRKDGSKVDWDRDQLRMVNWGVDPDAFELPAQLTRYTMPAEGAAVTEVSSSILGPPMNVCGMSWMGTYSRDGAWWFFVRPGRQKLGVATAEHAEESMSGNWVQDRSFLFDLSVDSNEAGPPWIRASLAAGDVKIAGMPMASYDGSRVVAVLENLDIGVWTRSRQHFEWWGIYEQPECWLAAALLIGFVWSVRRDWIDARKIALAPKSVSPTVSV